ncbi:O-antigen ligase family protein [Gryllotalpicola reticulitermitis]|uniref:O-antigen ligase family protein n=1 Tax=Gryllotalpicola reticulitermitis TaxID=1184153 RepID=A0ABV8Q5E3_9MICO
MTDGGPWRAFDEPLRRFAGSEQFADALALAIMGTAFGAFAIIQVIGWPGLVGALGALVVLASVSFVGRRDRVEWHGLLPISLIVFVGWCAVSGLWSANPGTTLASALYQWSWAFLAIYLALVRDTGQLVRTVGDVLRFLLSFSMALEVFSGLLSTQPVHYLGVSGTIAHGGPIEGIFGTRNALALVSVIALVTFFVEWRTRSVRRGTAAYSLVIAAASAALSKSPVAVVVLVLVAASALFLWLLRSIRHERARFSVQIVLAGVTVAAGIAAWILRDSIIALLDARSTLLVRHELWIHMWVLSKERPLTGWGWTGLWHGQELPYNIINALSTVPHPNGLNAYLDVLLQLGIAGVLIFGVLTVLALGRSWLVASNLPHVIHIWTPLVLITLLATSAAESSILVDYGWVLLVICTVNAAQNMSWRSALPRATRPLRAR